MSLPPYDFMGKPNDELMENLKVYSATKYGKSRADVEKEIEDRWSTAERAKAAANVEDANESIFESKTAPTPQNSSEGGFLDGWLNQQDDWHGKNTIKQFLSINSLSDSHNYNSYGRESDTEISGRVRLICCNFDDRERRKAKKLFNSVLSGAQWTANKSPI